MPIADRVPQTRTEFERSAEVEIIRARRLGHPLGLALCRIDQFSATSGDWSDVAKSAARDAAALIIMNSIRLYDYFGSWDEESFAVLFPETTGTGALAATRRLVVAVRQGAEAAGAPDLLTVSIGLAAADDPVHEDLSTLAAAASRALDHAQRSGGNRVEVEPRDARATAA